MFFILLILFIVIPVVELNVLIRVGDTLGSWNTVGLVILTAVVGVSLVRSQGISTLMQVQQKLSQGETPGKEIVEGMMLALAGLLLLIPGFVTDFIGLLLLTPITRSPIASWLYKRMELRVVNNSGFRGGFSAGGFNPQDFRQNPFERDQGNTFEGDFERKQDPDDKTDESHQLDDKQEPDNKVDPDNKP